MRFIPVSFVAIAALAAPGDPNAAGTISSPDSDATLTNLGASRH